MNNKKSNIGIIGTGNMGYALVKGIKANPMYTEIMIYDIDHFKLTSIQNETEVIIAKSIDEIINYSNLLILAVKPDITIKIASELKLYHGIIISIAAGISILSLQNITGVDKKIIRAMPNTPSIVGEGMTVISASSNLPDNEIEQVKSIFLSVGDVLIMDEKHMNAVTALSGSGPAYIFTFIQAMADAGVKLGIPRSESLLLAGQTIYGSVKMFLDKKENPIMLRDKVTSPGGTTISALHVLDKAGFNGIIIDAIEAAANRAKELDKS